MPTLTTTLLLLTVLVVLLPAEAYAFGAGDIPDFSYLNDKAFRHGDIENILTELLKSTGSTAAGGGLLEFAQTILSAGSGGSKFNKGDVKKVYFGNWLRDYSQAMDIAGLQKLSADTLVLIVAVLGFMTFGFATEEFEVTAERLGVYLPVEHIDNPKGYAEKEGDARQFHPKLRPPVDPRELEIDPRTGMKKYMATEGHGWDTSTAHIRRTLRACIEHGRRSRGREGADLFEAYRLLGTGLHTLEDLLAHSNWCELALRKMGHEQVFCHVGDDVIVDTPNGPAPPLITGTFGSADFMHSMMGEATDHLSQASVTDLSQKLSDASSSDQNSNISKLKDLLSKLPLGGDSSSQMGEAESLQASSKAYSFNPDDVAPKEVQQQLWALLKWRDGVYRDVLEKIEKIPGLSELIDGITDALNAYVYTILTPWLTPILKQTTDVLGEGSKAVIDSDDQYEVFNDPRASDPSHSLLSKDHFQLILNEPAGKIAQVVVQNTVNLIVKAWFDESEDPNQVINQVLEAFHHPYYNTGNSQIQHAMFDAMDKWIGGQGSERETTLEALTKESVREGKNKRQGSDDETAATPGGAHSYDQGAYGRTSQYTASQDYTSSQGGGYNQPQGRRYDEEPIGYGGGSRTGYSRTESNYQPPEEPPYGRGSETLYGRGDSRPSYGRQEEGGYGGGRDEEPPYARRQEQYRSEVRSYDRRQDDEGGYRPSYTSGGSEGYAGGEGYGSRREEGYERPSDYGGDSFRRSEQTEPVEPRDHQHHSHHDDRRQEYDSSGQEYGRGGEEYDAGRQGPERETVGYGASREEYGSGTEQYGGGREVYESQRRPGYGEEQLSGYRDNESSPYAEPPRQYGGSGYGGGPGGYAEDERRGLHRGEESYTENEDETFGAERLNLNEGYQRRGGYGGSGYTQEDY
ncbi:hypothetical protein HETIRDRAFT_121390 [Heterobasidion irregulare TC 32-1]|uniref:Het-C-domain-containing protein n=1 Tax=Heterobasidion irregulare (strain TC 32-1) TaxID=747525 RepID=W4KN82_HETIT|nr:uncharacterized protein HETIRDRAFT_121390 [Heterobasidion irregulare TC 32-1]ETW86830.1 hypothetical protein HETIRDRAFT_121390 [Heterobasidion irregulare TC 32-1]